jgi:hypothetical protein
VDDRRGVEPSGRTAEVSAGGPVELVELVAVEPVSTALQLPTKRIIEHNPVIREKAPTYSSCPHAPGLATSSARMNAHLDEPRRA